MKKRSGKGSLVGWTAVVLLVCGGLGTAAWVCADESEPEVDSAARAVAVICKSPKRMEFVRGVSVAGDVRAVGFALVSARVPGTLDEVRVDEGDRVRAGETILFRTDSIGLEQELEVARRGLDVADSSSREARANRKRLAAVHEQASRDTARYRRLRDQDVATIHQLELAETRLREAAATLEHAEAVVDLARARQAQSHSRLAIAEKNLQDSVVTAPIDGVVVERLREPGEMAGAGTPVLRLEDLSRLEVTAFLPEESYGEIVPGETPARIRSGSIDLGELPLSFRGPVVDSKHRNFEVKVLVPDPPPGVVPGRLVQLTAVLEAREALGVPRHAVLERGGRSLVFVIEGGRALAVIVETGLPTDGWIEVLGEGLFEDSELVVEGQDWLEDGDAVKRVEGR